MRGVQDTSRMDQTCEEVCTSALQTKAHQDQRQTDATELNMCLSGTTYKSAGLSNCGQEVDMYNIFMQYQEPARVHDQFERIVVNNMFGWMSYLIYVLGFLVLFGDMLVGKWYCDSSG